VTRVKIEEMYDVIFNEPDMTYNLIVPECEPRNSSGGEKVDIEVESSKEAYDFL